MSRVLVGLLLLDAMILAAAVLLQAGKGGGLAASFGGAGSSPNSLLGSREAGNLLTKASWWAGGLFIGLAFVLQIMAGQGRTPRSVLDAGFGPPQGAGTNPATAPTKAAPLQPITPPAKQPPPGKQPPAGKQP